jgi:hypothetical protein
LAHRIFDTAEVDVLWPPGLIIYSQAKEGGQGCTGSCGNDRSAGLRDLLRAR